MFLELNCIQEGMPLDTDGRDFRYDKRYGSWLQNQSSNRGYERRLGYEKMGRDFSKEHGPLVDHRLCFFVSAPHDPEAEHHREQETRH